MENISHMPIPIAELSPAIQEPASRLIKAVVTLTWPYSSATGSVAFLLAEPDFRLRRTRGQVRVQFAGSSAKHVAKSNIASGDEIVLCLDGVEWIYDAANVTTPGRGIEYELKFTERLLLQVRAEGSEIAESVDIDHPTPEPQPEREPPAEVISVDITPSFTPPPVHNVNGTSSRTNHEADNDGIFSSPAFVKRARTSYGSLFELDPFSEEDGTVPGKGRKRTRLSSTWKYASRSPTPEVEQSEEADASNILAESVTKEGPIMTDEGCQTIGWEDSNAVETLASFSRQAINVGGGPYIEATIPNPEAHSPTDIPTKTQPPTVVEHISDQERVDALDGGQGVHVSPQPLHEPLQTLPAPEGFVVDVEQSVPSSFTDSDKPRNLEYGNETNDSLPVDGHLDLYAASPHDPRDEGKLGTFGNLHIPAADVNKLEPRISESVDQFISEAMYDEPQDAASHLQHLASPDALGEGPNEMKKTGKLYFEEDHDRGHFEHGSSPTSHPIGSTIQQYPDLDRLAQQNLVPTWGAPPASATFPEIHGAHDRDRTEDRSSRVSQTPGPAAMSRSQSAQTQVVDLTESSDEENEEDQFEEDEYSEAEDDEGYEQTEEQEGFEENIITEKEKHDESALDAENNVTGAIRDHYLQQAARRGEEYFKGSQEDQDGYYEDEYEEGRVDPQTNIMGDSLDDEEFESVEEYYDEEDEGRLESVEDYYDEEEENEENYDGEMDDYETPPAASAPKKPVVIDLLSSDDEAAEEPSKPKPPIASPQHSQPPAPALAESEESEEGGLDEDMRESQDASSSPEEEGTEDSDEEMQDNQYTSSPDPLQAVLALEEPSMRERSVEQERPPTDQASEGHEVNAEMNVEVPGGPPTVVDATLSIPEGPAIEGGQAVEPRPTYDLVKDIAESKDDEEHVQLEITKAIGTMVTDGHSEATNEVPPESLASNARGTKRMPSARPLGLDGANDEPIVRSTPRKLPRDGPSSLPSTSYLKLLPLPYDDNLVKGGSVQSPTPNDTQISEAVVSAETSFSAGLDSQDSVFVSQGTFITQASSLADEPAPETETRETKPEAEGVEPSRSSDVDHNGHEPSSDVVKTSTKELTRGESPKANEEQATKEAAEEATEDVATKERTEDIVPGEETDEKLNGESKDSKKTVDEPQPKTKAPPVASLRRSHRRIKSTSSSIEPGGEEMQHEIQETVVVTPRRSHRRIKSITPSADPSEIRPETPGRSGGKNDIQTDVPLQMAIHEPSTPKGYDASFELALSSLDSPSKVHDLRKPLGADLKLRLSRALRTELGEFTALKVLRYHLNQKLDVLAIVTTTPPEPQRSKGGPRHYQITFNITDPTIAPSGVTEVQIFRPYKEALPVVQTGDGVLLRNFQVISVKNRGFGLRSDQNEASSWVVFKDGEEAEVRGPPVEYGIPEKDHVASMKTWYGTLDTVAMTKLNRANADKGTSPGKTTRKTT